MNFESDSEERRDARQTKAGPLLDARRQWLDATGPKLSRRSDFAVAIPYALTRWPALTRYADDGRLEIDDNAAERSLRGIAVGRKNWLFAGSDQGGTARPASTASSKPPGSTASTPRHG